VPGLGKPLCDFPKRQAGRREFARRRHRALHLGIGFQVHAVLGEPKARRNCTHAFAALALPCEPAPDLPLMLGSLSRHPSNDVIRGVETQTSWCDDGNTEPYDELADAGACRRQMPQREHAHEIESAATPAPNEPATQRTSTMVLALLLVQAEGRSLGALECGELRAQ
jgi:hypothetical protein